MRNVTFHSVMAAAALAVQKLRVFFAGHKTYTLVALAIVYSLGIQYGWWQSDSVIWTTLSGGVALTVRAACIRLITQFLDDMTKASAIPPQK